MNRVVVVQYQNEDGSPRVLFKRQGLVADKVVALAQEVGVAVVRNSQLLDELWATEDGGFVCEELFGILAEVLAFVYMHEEGEA